MRILCAVNGNYGLRIAQHLARTAPTGWDVQSWTGPSRVPDGPDDSPEACLQGDIPRADLLLVLSEGAGFGHLAFQLALLCQAGAVIAPVDRLSWLPEGLALQLGGRFRKAGIGFAAPAPFCNLTPRGFSHPAIVEFAQRYGRPELGCCVRQGSIRTVEIVREAPCGNTRFVAERLVGCDVENAPQRAGLLHHYYPCLAGMEQAPFRTHTLLHQAAKIMCATVARAVSSPMREENDYVSAAL